MNVQNAKPVPQKDGSIQFVDSKGNTLFTIPRPLMVDAKDRISHNAKLELRTDGKETYLDLKANEKWLQDPQRAYPVVIDPSLTIQGTTDTYDAFVGNKDTTVQNTNYGGLTYLITGNYVDYGITRSFIKFKLQPLLSGAQISSAKLYLNQYSTVANQQVNLYPVTSNWTSSDVKWVNQPTIGSLLSSTIVGEWENTAGISLPSPRTGTAGQPKTTESPFVIRLKLMTGNRSVPAIMRLTRPKNQSILDFRCHQRQYP
nr:DNRLRE domain-containing protein [Thermoactinomyces mirandus]